MEESILNFHKCEELVPIRHTCEELVLNFHKYIKETQLKSVNTKVMAVAFYMSSNVG